MVECGAIYSYIQGQMYVACCYYVVVSVFPAKMFLKKLENVTHNKEGWSCAHSVHTSVGSLGEGEEVGRLTCSHVILLQLGKDVLAIGVFPEGSDMGADLVHEDLPLCWLRHVNHLLHDVVGVLVLHHCVQGTVGGGG